MSPSGCELTAFFLTRGQAGFFPKPSTLLSSPFSNQRRSELDPEWAFEII